MFPIEQLTKQEQALVDLVLGHFFLAATSRHIPLILKGPRADIHEEAIKEAIALWLIESRESK